MKLLRRPLRAWTLSRQFRSLMPGLASLAGGLIAMLVAGCSEETIEYREVRRPDEVLRQREWNAFVRIVQQLPEPKLQGFSATHPPLPQWQEARTLPVDELASEERAVLDRYSDPTRYSPDMRQSRAIARLVREEQLTMDQFAGLILSIGAAMRSAALPEEFPLGDIVRRGKAAAVELFRDQRLFASLSIEDRHRVLDDAVWLHRVHRAEMLQKIPGENVALVRKHREWLQSVMPAEFSRFPFDDVVDLLEEQGLPFVEPPGAESDAAIEWQPADAIVGR